MNHVVIIGAGFAGLSAAKVLARDSSIRATVINRYDTLQFKPLLPDILSRTVPFHLIIPAFHFTIFHPHPTLPRQG